MRKGTAPRLSASVEIDAGYFAPGKPMQGSVSTEVSGEPTQATAARTLGQAFQDFFDAYDFIGRNPRGGEMRVTLRAEDGTVLGPIFRFRFRVTPENRLETSFVGEEEHPARPTNEKIEIRSTGPSAGIG